MTDDICPSIISERLPYPVGGINPIIGRLFYENSAENSNGMQLYSFGSSILFLQGLTNGTFKLVSVSSITSKHIPFFNKEMLKWIYILISP